MLEKGTDSQPKMCGKGNDRIEIAKKVKKDSGTRKKEVEFEQIAQISDGKFNNISQKVTFFDSRVYMAVVLCYDGKDK